MVRLKEKIIQKIINSKTLKRWIKKYSTKDRNKILPITNNEYPLLVDNYPKIVNLELTNKCIMKCCMCPRTYSMTRKQGFMDLEFFKKIIDEYVFFNIQDEISVLWLHHFGESLLHPDFDKAIEYAISKGLRTGISINPLALTEEKATRLFKAKPTVVFFMMDGDNNESFYKIRGVKDAYDISINNALKGIEIKERISPETELEITIIENPAFKESVDNAEYFWRNEHNIKIQRKPFWTWNGDVDEISKMGCNQGQDNICNSPWDSVCITWDGLVVPCCADYNNLNVIGDLKRQSLLEIWNAKPIQNLRNDLKSGIIKNKLCSKCMYTKHTKQEQKGSIVSQKNAIEGSYMLGENSTIQPSAKFYNYLSDPSAITIGDNSNIENRIVNYSFGGCVKIGDYCHIGEGGNIYCASKVDIGNNVLIAHDVDIFDNDTHPIDPIARQEHYLAIITGQHFIQEFDLRQKPIKICDNVWIGAKAIILKGVTIGECAIVAAGSIVTKDVESYTIVAGNPAKKIEDIARNSSKCISAQAQE